ncbi:hypothetical protein [Chitinophaga agri]|uniref:Uncharacterized protein n=1 Tax=Chitinophaga agri TaxID=2703787 RepID=A0A6B9ZA15_9BACT|nr:hypothetical protein [Chitinophaga agri]QHS59162.1 hypothetical protein GWR21_06040 [Chitinophaga agri]
MMYNRSDTTPVVSFTSGSFQLLSGLGVTADIAICCMETASSRPQEQTEN